MDPICDSSSTVSDEIDESSVSVSNEDSDSSSEENEKEAEEADEVEVEVKDVSKGENDKEEEDVLDDDDDDDDEWASERSQKDLHMLKDLIYPWIKACKHSLSLNMSLHLSMKGKTYYTIVICRITPYYFSFSHPRPIHSQSEEMSQS